MFASIGVSEEQVFGDLFLAWLKDTGEKNTNDSRKLFREVVEHGFGDRQIILRKERLGANVAASLAALLHRSPLTKLDLHGNTLRDSGCEMIAHLIRDIPNLLYLDLGANDIGSFGIQTLSHVVASHKKLQTLILGSSQHDAYANRINAASATILLEGCLRSRTLRHLDLSGSTIGDREIHRAIMGYTNNNNNNNNNNNTNNTTTTSSGSLSRNRGIAGEFNVAPPPLNSFSRGGNRPTTSATRKGLLTSSSPPGGINGGNGTINTNMNGGDDDSCNNSSAGSHRRPIDVLAELISTSTTLTTLKLREVQLTTDAALRIIHAAMQSSSFAFIDLSGNALTGAVGDAFGDLVRGRALQQNPSALHTILLSYNPLMRPNSGMQPPRLFASLSSDAIIVRLYLDSCGIDDAAMEPLCHALGTNNGLLSLHLKNNAITSNGAVMLARALFNHMLLQDISLEGNILKDEGACAFASMLESNTTLLSLNLAHTWMGERGVVALGVSLAENKTLQRLNIDENHFTEDAGEAFAALLEGNHYLLRCGLQGNSIGHHTVLRVEKVTARNREAYHNTEKVDLEKDLIRLHYQMYKLDEARTELENLRQKKLELGRAMEAFDLQFKQDRTDCAKKERELQEMLDNYITQEAHCLDEKKRLDTELEEALKQTEVDMELAKERLEAESALREKVDEEHKQLKAQLDDMTNNGPQREAAKRQQLKEINEDRQRWAAQRKEYKAAISELQAVVNEMQQRENAAAKRKKGKKGK